MSLRLSCLITAMLIVSLLSAAVVHACSDLSALNAVVQTPCDHHQPKDEPLNKADKDNCDSIRYSMLSTQSSRFQTEILKQCSIPLDLALLSRDSVSEALFSLYRSQSPFSASPGVWPRLSHVVLRI